MKVLYLLSWVSVLVLVVAVVIWTGHWVKLFLFEEMREAMFFGIFPTLIGTALLVWLLFFSIPSQRQKANL